MSSKDHGNKHEVFMEKLELLQRIRVRGDDLEVVSTILKQEVTSMRQEEDNLKDYKAELDQLLAEKLHHVEILRQIHSDINMMESVIKQGQEALWLAESRSVGLCKEYEPLKSEVNCLREEAGLEAVDEDPALEPSSLAQLASRLKGTKRRSSAHNEKTTPQSHKRSHTTSQHEKTNAMLDTKTSSSLPPMKQCASCHQPIHRNAPICPLCKAKSRSRNPKKSKK